MNRHSLKGGLTAEQLDIYDREGYVVLENLLSEEDMEAPRQAMMHKVSMIADELFEAGLIQDKLEHRLYRIA